MKTNIPQVGTDNAPASLTLPSHQKQALSNQVPQRPQVGAVQVAELAFEFFVKPERVRIDRPGQRCHQEGEQMRACSCCRLHGFLQHKFFRRWSILIGQRGVSLQNVTIKEFKHVLRALEPLDWSQS